MTKTIKNPSVAVCGLGRRANFMALCLKASFRTSLELITVSFRNADGIRGKNTALCAEKHQSACYIYHKSRRNVFIVFSAMMAELGHQAVGDFKPAQELALRCKAGRTTQEVKDLSHRSGVF